MNRWSAGMLTLVITTAGGCDPSRSSSSRDGPPLVPARSAPPRRVNLERAPKVEVTLSPYELCVRLAGFVRCSGSEPGEGLLVSPPLFAEPVNSYTLGGAECLSTTGGEVLCRGENQYGALGAGLRDDKSDTFVRAIGISNARTVSAGGGHVCALLDDGRVSCWGNNRFGQTGGDTHYEPDARELVRPAEVPFVSGATKVVTGNESTCVLTKERRVTCWGELDVGAGTGVSTRDGQRVLASLADVEDVAGSGYTFCAVSRGDVYCWGALSALADEDAALTKVPGLHDARRVGVGYRYACALASDGRVWCWGNNDDGQLGRGAVEGTTQPAPLDLPPAIAISVGDHMACAVAESNDVFCWGRWPRPFDRNDPEQEEAPRARTPVRVLVR